MQSQPAGQARVTIQLGIIIHCPVLPFLVSFENRTENHAKNKQGFFIPPEPLKSLKKKGKRSKDKDFLARGKKKTRKSKKKQGKEGQGGAYHDIQNDYTRQTFILRAIDSYYRYRILLSEEL